MSELKLTVRDLQDSWACKHAQQELSSDERVAEITALLDQERADAWDEGANALEHHQMHVSGGWPTNPYRKEQHDE